MGGCASKPRDLDITAPVLVEAPVLPETTVAAAAPQEAKVDGVQNKKEESSVDSSEPVPVKAEEAVQAETEPAKAEAKPVEEEPKEEKKEVA